MKRIILVALTTLFYNVSIGQTALDFDPASGDQSVELTSMLCPSEFTFEAWINYDTIANFWETILEYDTDEPYFGTEDGKLTVWPYIYSPNTLPFGQWTHVACSYSTINQEAKLYVNGALVATETNVGMSTSGTHAAIGQNQGGETFNGSIDDVRIWEVVRTDAEILNNMNVCLTGSEAGLYAYYNFNEGTGTVANDLTANNFHGVLTNLDPSTDWVPHTFCNGAVSVNDQMLDEVELTLFPNPSTGFVETEGLEITANYTIYNMLGKAVKKGTINPGERLDVQELTNGVYFFQIDALNRLKFIKN